MNQHQASSEAFPVVGERRSDERASSAGGLNLVAGLLIDGKYRLVEQLGRGGMSRVWLAHHEALRTQVAIKFVDERLTLDEETRSLTLERFRFEAQISARLGVKTKHVVAVQDAGSHDGAPYLVMELVAGHTLEQEIDKGGPVDPDRLGAILEQAAGALAVAHDLGIVHRDVKPSNVVVVDAPPGELFVKMGDFGVAKATRASSAFDRPTETNQGFLVGSPAFMSPEQLRAGGGIDARTDVWGMGVVAYEALTGQLPFVGVSEADLIVLISTAPHEPVTKDRPELPKALDGWFARALAKEPAERFASATEAARAFRVALEPPVVASAKRAPPIGIVLAVAALVAALGVGVFLLRHHDGGAPVVEQRAVETGPTEPAAVAEPAPPPPESTAAAPTSSPASDAPPPNTAARAHRHVAPHAPHVKAAPAPEPAAQPRVRKEINPSEIQ